MNKKFIILLALGIFLAVYLSVNISAVCCEKTTDGELCQNVASASNCDSDFEFNENIACDSTSFCSAGTCVDSSRGECVPSTRATCDPSLGGYFYEQPIGEIPECQKVCCIINGPDYVEKVTCNSIGSEYNVQPEIIEGITAEQCYSLQDADVKGACVTQGDRGRTCSITTKSDCQGEFSKGLLCTAQELGTICARTTTTSCMEGKNKVYFKDNCGNFANVYDSDKTNDEAYWTYMKSQYDEEICDDGSGNKLSDNCGNCEFNKGTTCGQVNGADYGDYMCRDIGCPTGKLAENFLDVYKNTPKNEDSWCVDSFGKSTDINNFENAAPGQTSFRASCFMGEIQIQLGNQYRNKLCVDQRNYDSDTIRAVFVPNRWQDCWIQNNTADCENTDIRDCKTLTGVPLRQTDGYKEFLNTSTDKKIKAACIPRYNPGLNFWEPKNNINSQVSGGESMSAEGICDVGSTLCGAVFFGEYDDTWGDGRLPYYEWDAYDFDCADKCNQEKESMGEKEDCIEECGGSLCYTNKRTSDDLPKKPKVKNNWLQGTKNLCSALGDCGVKSNYYQTSGYNIWKDLFNGNINEEQLI